MTGIDVPVAENQAAYIAEVAAVYPRRLGGRRDLGRCTAPCVWPEGQVRCEKIFDLGDEEGSSFSGSVVGRDSLLPGGRCRTSPWF